MSPDDDRLIERLGRALAAPAAELTPAELDRFHNALRAGRLGARRPERAGERAAPVLAEVIALSPVPRPFAWASDAVERELASAFEALSTGLLRRDVNEVRRAAGELRSRLAAHGREVGRDAVPNARRLLREAAVFVLSSRLADPRPARG